MTALSNPHRTFHHSLEIEHTKLFDKSEIFTTTLSAACEKISNINENHRLKKLNEDTFNILNCLTRHHLEELHSRFFTYLLDPLNNHGFTDSFLAIFMRLLFKEVGHDHDFSKRPNYLLGATVIREHLIDKFDDVYGRIDIFINAPQFCVAIENKVRSVQHNNQLERYWKYCEKQGKPFFVIYLTPSEVVPNSLELNRYIMLSYERHIVNWLNDCILTASGNLEIITGIKWYKQIVENKILPNTINKISMDITKLLLEKENHLILKYYDQIAEAITPYEINCEDRFLRVLQSI